MTIRALGTPWASPGERQYSLPTSLMLKLALGETPAHVPTVRDIARGALAAATSIDGGAIDRIIGAQTGGFRAARLFSAVGAHGAGHGHLGYDAIEQMQAYQEMIASVAKSLHQFMDDNVSDNQGRDNMVDQFPDLFQIGQSDDDWGDQPAGPKLELREGVDEGEALKQVNNKLQFENGALKSLDLSDANVEKALIENSRMQLARQRQQLMASIVLMGINRIVVTDGKISAKIIYDVRANDTMSKRRTASAVDMARDRYGNVQQTSSGSGKYDSGGKRDYSRSDGNTDYSADYYAKGEYQYENKPIITAQTAASEASTAALQTKIQLSGAVDVNFKSDYLPLDKMATPQMIAAIQGNATPADPNVVPSPKAAPAAPAPAPAPAA